MEAILNMIKKLGVSMDILYVHHGNRLKGNSPTQDDDLTELGYKDCEFVKFVKD